MGAGAFVAYYVCAASLLLLLRWRFKPPRELFRKMLHIVCVLSIFVLVRV